MANETHPRDALQRLARRVNRRARQGIETRSYTAALLAEGREKCAKKFGEEAIEAALAAVSGTKTELIAECADTLYHMLVMLESNNVSLARVYTELDRRSKQSGIEEKARRKSGK